MDRLQELLQILSDEDARARLTDTEVGEMHAELAALFAQVRAGEVEGVEPYDTETLESIGNCLAALAVESGMRFAAAEEASERIAEIERASGLVSETTDDAEVEETDEAAEAASEIDDAEVEEAAEEELEPVVASALPSLAELNARTPRPRRAAIPATVIDDRDGLATLTNGQRIPVGDVPDFIAEEAGRRGRLPQDERVVLAQIPTVRAGTPAINSRLDSPEAITRKLDEAVGQAISPRMWDANGRPSEALVASGGWGAPSPVLYDLAQISEAARPIRDALPTVTVDRGGLTFVRPPKYSDVVTGGPSTTTTSDAATGVWTNTTDITPGSDVKTHQDVPVGTPTTVTLDAIYMHLQHGVLQSRAFPEWVRTWTQNTQAAWAFEAERRKLDLIEASAITVDLTSTKVLSATRDFLAEAIFLAAAERRRQRMAPDAVVQVLYPTWLLDLVQADLIRSGTNFVDSTPLVVARTYLEGQLRNANIVASDYWDYSTESGNPISAQSAGVLNELVSSGPTTARWYMYHAGAFVNGDGGTLDVGIIRDSSLVNTNDYRIFMESFETIFDRGIWAYQVDSEVCANGTSSASIDIHTHCDGS